MTMKKINRFLGHFAAIFVLQVLLISCDNRGPEVCTMDFWANGRYFVALDTSEDYTPFRAGMHISIESSKNEFFLNSAYCSAKSTETDEEYALSNINLQLRVTLNRMKFPTNAMHVRYVHDGVNVIMEFPDVNVRPVEPIRHSQCRAIVKSGEIFFVEYRPKYPYYRATFEIEADLELLADDGAVVKTVPLHIIDGRLEYGYPVGQ